MKIRNGFVSNSSSSSFVIQKTKLTSEQIAKIKNHREYISALCDEWRIRDFSGILFGATNMDNFDMESFLDLIGVSNSDIEWGDD
jgi:hypothetical protein